MITAGQELQRLARRLASTNLVAARIGILALAISGLLALTIALVDARHALQAARRAQCRAELALYRSKYPKQVRTLSLELADGQPDAPCPLVAAVRRWECYGIHPALAGAPAAAEAVCP